MTFGRFLPLLSLALAGPLAAQSLTRGELTGIVLTPAGPGASAEVRLTPSAGGGERSTITTHDGTFRMGLLPLGRYTVTVDLLGYRPVVMLGVTISAGVTRSLEFALREVGTGPIGIDTVVAAPAGGPQGAWFASRGLLDLVSVRRLSGDASLLSTTADEEGIEGLPWRLADVNIDGSRSLGNGRPGGNGADAPGLQLPLGAASEVVVGGLGVDVETGGTGVGLRALTRAGGAQRSPQLTLEGGTAGLGGGLALASARRGDSLVTIFGAEYQVNEFERPAPLGAASPFATGLVNAAQASHGTDLAAYALPAARRDERIGAFGRLDWQASDRLTVSGAFHGARLASTGLAERGSGGAPLGADHEAIAARARLAVYAALAPRTMLEVCLATDVSRASEAEAALPTTTFADDGFALGALPAEPFSEERVTPRMTSALHVDAGAHRLKVGFTYASHRLGGTTLRGRSGEFLFGDLADFAAGEGVWRGVEASAATPAFRLTESALFVQDAWQITDGLGLTFGARFDRFRLPVDELERNASWQALSGLDTRGVNAPTGGVSPRIGLRWEFGATRAWTLDAGLGLYRDLPDRRDLLEAFTLDRGAVVRSAVGTLGGWPAAPASALAPEVGRTLTMLGADYEGPRTQRAAVTLTRRLGTWAVSVRGIHRYTDLITVRRDLNLPLVSGARDQHGRPLFGELVQVGALVAAAPGSNRRFGGFDAAYALEASGASEYRAASIELDRVRADGLSLHAAYTFSRTTDDVASFAQDRLPAFPGDRAWARDISDLDVPHRVLVAGAWRPGRDGPLEVAVAYRLRSGRPFTPRVATGVDANGDGDAGNDPAFIDAALAGMPALLGAHDCLADQVGGFAARNSCRGDLAQRLDLRLELRVARLARARVLLVLDALDVVATETGRLDDALLLVDRTGTLTRDPLTGVTTVPYIVNPRFGQLLADRSAGVLWRASLRIVP